MVCALAVAGCTPGESGIPSDTASASATASPNAGGQDDGACDEGLTRTDAICVDGADPQATQVVDAIRGQFQPGVQSGVVFGVWKDRKPLATGALGEGQSGVPAARDMRVRIGNVTEAMVTTQLLRLVEQGKLALSDPISEWFPTLPNADTVTVNMLAHSTSGYNDFVTTQEFSEAQYANPFRIWDTSELLQIAMSEPPLFPPGTSWAFSDTNFVLLGQILEKVSGQPMPEQLAAIWDELGMTDTAMSVTSDIPPPVLHAYTDERGFFEDATYWSPSWVRSAANVTSTVDDMGAWATAVAEGSALQPESHELHLAPETAGLGPMTEDAFYAMGLVVAGGWIGSNPQIDGYTGIVAYHPASKIAVAVFATMGPAGDIAVAYATDVYGAVADVVTPGQKLPFQSKPRGNGGN